MASLTQYIVLVSAAVLQVGALRLQTAKTWGEKGRTASKNLEIPDSTPGVKNQEGIPSELNPGLSELNPDLHKEDKDLSSWSTMEDSEFVSCKKNDGFGAQYMCQMAAFAHARKTGDCFVYQNFEAKGFHDKTNIDPQTFTGLESDDKSKCNKAQNETVLHTPFIVQNSSWWTKETRDELRKMYEKNPKPKLDEQCDVALHIRRGDVSWGSRFLPNSYIANAIKYMFNATQKVCVISEGHQWSFGQIQQLPNVVFKLRDTADVAFHRMVSAPVMVVSKSCFSYTAAILSKGTVYTMQNIRMPNIPGWLNVRCKDDVCETTDFQE